MGRGKPPIWVPAGPPRRKHQPLGNDDRWAMLLALTGGHSISAIARALPASVRTVSMFRKKIVTHPTSVFDLPVLRQIGKKAHQCRLCGETLPSRVKGMRHVLQHFLPRETATSVDLGNVPKPL